MRAEICTHETGGSVHLCGDASRHFQTLRGELGIRSFGTGFPIDHGRVRKKVGEEVEILGGPHVELLRSGSAKAVYQAAREILDSGVKEGGRFILREGNNLAPGTPLENVAALHEAARTAERYHAP